MRLVEEKYLSTGQLEMTRGQFLRSRKKHPPRKKKKKRLEEKEMVSINLVYRVFIPNYSSTSHGRLCVFHLPATLWSWT